MQGQEAIELLDRLLRYVATVEIVLSENAAKEAGLGVAYLHLELVQDIPLRVRQNMTEMIRQIRKKMPPASTFKGESPLQYALRERTEERN